MSAHTVIVRDRAGEEARFSVAAGERVLHAGLMAGAGLPHECATGTCGSCRARIEDGAVERLWPEAPGAARFRSDNDVLMCQVGASADLTLSLRGKLTCPPQPPVCARAGILSASARLTSEVGLFDVTLDAPLPYAAGQFALVEFDGIAGPRAYSMISYAPDEPVLKFLVRHGGGPASAFLFGDSALPASVSVMGPFGAAVFDPSEARPFVAIAGGSGIAGILSILDRAEAAGHFARHPCAVYFGLRAPDTAYQLDTLAELVARADGKLSVTIAYSDAEPGEDVARYPALEFAQGFVHEVAGADHDAHPQDAIRYVAGPPKMVDAAMRLLVMEKKVSPTDIRYDKFG
ncbi:MAG: 2Fe-2S iron-sulfur cluster binding domain-containing protein [Pseudomonadota bacterium]